MKLPRRRFLHLAAGAAALPVVSRIARAQAYPTRPVRIIVGFAPGGTADIVARLIGQWLSERLGQPFIVESRPGAASNIATEAVVRAPADGYTLLLAGTQNTINATLYDKLNFVFLRDIAPIASIIRLSGLVGCAHSRSQRCRALIRCRTSRPWVSSSRATRRAAGIASAHLRARPPKSSTWSTRRSTQPLPILR